MSKNPSDIEAFQEQWAKRGRDVRVLDFSPDVILVQLSGPFSVQELEKISEFLRECADDE
jgi:hypothetical protein